MPWRCSLCISFESQSNLRYAGERRGDEVEEGGDGKKAGGRRGYIVEGKFNHVGVRDELER